MGKLYMLLFIVVQLLLAQNSSCTGSEGDQLIFNVTCSIENCHSQSESHSLEAVAAEMKEHSHVNVDINIVIPAIQLSSNISFTNLSSLNMTGNSGQMITITCKANTGILFTNISDTLSLINLKLLSCGSSLITSTKGSDKEMVTYVSALSMIHCRNVEIHGLDIHRSRGLGLTILDHREGRVKVTSTTFKYNELPEHFTNASDPFIGGGGVHLDLSYFPTDQNPMAFTFDNCTFEKNTADKNRYDYLYTDAVGVPRKGAGKGGGMNLILGPSIKGVNISFIKCNFTCNQAFHGSGLAIKLLGEENKILENIKIEILDSTFEQNGKNSSYGLGAGLYLSFHDASPHKGTVMDCHAILMNVRFVNNQAECGGGLFFFSSKQSLPNSNSLLFNNCTFMENGAYLGSGVLISPDMFFTLSGGYSVAPVFKDCQFLANKVNPYYHNQQRDPGLGTVYISESRIQFQGYNRFENNTGCGIYLVNGVIDLQNSSMLFINNAGFNGGAVTLIGSSTMIVGHNNYRFINNTAVYRGGAIYVSLFDTTDFTTSRRCFIQYVNDEMKVLTHRWNLSLTFAGNRARVGYAIFATSFLPCQIVDSTILEISEIFHSRSEHITFDDNIAIEDQLSTDGTVLNVKESQQLTIIPGIEHQLGVTLSNDFNNTVQVPFRATLEKTVGEASLDPAKSQYVGNEVELIGSPGAEAKLTLYMASRRDSYIEFNVSLTDCPPGFKLTKDLKCVCNVAAYTGLLRCDSSHSYLFPGYWAGIFKTTNGQKLVTSACPFHAQFHGFEIKLPDTFSETEFNKQVCGETRRGIGCGRCQESLTAYFHSPDFECGPSEPFDCKLGWLFYILSELMPVTLIFISVLLLNISFTSGAVNGFILFSQLLHSFDTYASGIIQFPEHVKAKIEDATHVYKFLYGFLNLCMFNAKYFSFCIWKDASTLDLLALKYVSIVYALLLITTVILIMNKCGGRCLGKYCRITVIKVSIIRGISTFLILCYTQCIRVSTSILFPLHIHVPADDTNFTCTSCTKVWFNGDLQYFHEEHLPYAVPALFCLLTIGLLPPLLLITYPLFNKLSLILDFEGCTIVTGISHMLPTNYLKPILDSFQGCFKDSLRFFAGLYFLYRWTFNLIYFVKSYDEYYTMIGCVLLFILTMHTICQPYIKTAHNVIDALLFVDLILINSLSYFNFHKVSSQKAQYGTTVTPAIVQLVLIYLPLLIMATYLIATFCMWIIKQGVKNQNVTKGNVIVKKALKMRALLQGTSTQGEGTETGEEELFHDRVEYHEW